MPRRASDIEAEIDGLFQLPLAAFTAARNALASQLKKQGRAEDAERARALQKPPVSAWAVNQLAWRRRSDVDALLAIGERFRAAQAKQLAGKSTDLRGLLNERRAAMSALMQHASAILEESGHAASPETTRRVMTTLEALATYGRTHGAPQAGRLVDDIDPPGFEALAALVPRSGNERPGAEPPRVLPFTPEGRSRRSREKKAADDEAERRARARAAVQAAEAALREAQRDAARAEAALKKAAARAKAAEKARLEIEPRYERVVAEAQAAAKDARRVAEEAENAAQAVTDAERELEKAREQEEGGRR